MKIEVFGPGCAKCKKTSEAVENVVRQLGIDATIEHVTDTDAIIERGVLLTPAVFIDDERKSEGKVPKPSEIEKWLQK